MSTHNKVMGWVMALALVAGGCGTESNEPLEPGVGKADQEMIFVASGTTCKNETREPAEPFGSGAVEVQVEGDALTVIHKDAMYNCALDESEQVQVEMTVNVDPELMKLTISERLVVSEGMALSRCVCPFDLQITIPDLPEGIFDLELIGEEGALVDKTVFQTGEDMCAPLDQSYVSALEGWQGCERDLDCRTFAGSDLKCGGRVAINNSFSADLEELRGRWGDERCHKLDWNCPLYTSSPGASAMPPWYKRVGYCHISTCKIRVVDTRAVLREGDSCGENRDRLCAAGLYCAGPPCGTPPVVMTCKKMGACDAVNNCLDTANEWSHDSCAGTASCDEGLCSWTCDGAGPF